MFTSRDKAFLAAADRQTKHVGDLLDTAHLYARLARHQREAENIKRALSETRRAEAADCMETSICAIEDSKAAL